MQDKLQNKSQEALKKAHDYVKLAAHILNTTYKVVSEPKVLLLVIENTFLASTNAIAALLYAERKRKTIPPFHDSFNSKYYIFSEKIAADHKFTKEEYTYIEDLRNILLLEKKSPVEFTRKDDYILCDEDYDITKITLTDTQKYLEKTTHLIKRVELLV